MEKAQNELCEGMALMLNAMSQIMEPLMQCASTVFKDIAERYTPELVESIEWNMNYERQLKAALKRIEYLENEIHEIFRPENQTT